MKLIGRGKLRCDNCNAKDVVFKLEIGDIIVLLCVDCLEEVKLTIAELELPY